MSIAWIYLDKKSAAVSALKDFSCMEYIINTHADDVLEVRESMTAMRSVVPADRLAMATADPHAGEMRLAASLDEIDILKERYRRALEYMEWFRPAWVTMSEDERFILTEFFIRDGDTKSDVVLSLGEHYHIERAQVYRRKDKAINRLALLLYGK